MADARNPPNVGDISELVALFPTAPGGIIALDGCLNAGKTTLMGKLALQLTCGSLDVDDYVARGQGRYVTAVRNADLDAAIERALKNSPIMVLAGVCMRAVLDRLGRSAAFNVYVQRDAPFGPPYDYEVLAFEDAPIDEDVEAGEIDAEDPSALCREVCRYHGHYRPRRNADVVYSWIDQGRKG